MMAVHKQSVWYKQPIAWILLAFVTLSFASSAINPLFESTDELRHYRFVQYIIQQKSLPVQGEVGCSAQGHHPPLFYALGAAATFWIDTGRPVCSQLEENPFWQYRYWEVGDDNKNLYLHTAAEAFPWSGEALAAHIVRGLNVLIGAGVVYLTWLLGRTLWPKRPSLAIGASAFVAFNPMFVYMAGSINNDVIAALSGTAVLLAGVKLVQSETGLSRRWGIWLGVLFGVALLSKFNLAAVALLIETAVTYTAWRKKQWRLWWEVNLLIAGFTLLLAGWWFVRNQILYGEPTGFQRLTELWGVRNPAESWGVAIFELPYTWTSLWGRFGYGQVPLPDGIYIGLRWLVGIGLLGLVLRLLPVSWLRERLTPSPSRERGQRLLPLTGGGLGLGSAFPLLLLTLNVALFFAVVFNYLLVSPAGAMGRFFFPALPALALLTFYGLSAWVELFGGTKPTAILAAAVNVGMATLTVVAIFVYLAAAFAQPEPFAADAGPNPTNAQFDSFAILRGFELDDTTLQPGGVLTLDLYWEVIGQPPGNFLLFVHLIDEETGTLIAQRDTHPGLGNFPSSQWQPGDRFVDSIRLHASETMYAPATAVLSIGLYAPGENSYRLGIAAEDGSFLGDALPLADITIAELDNWREDGQSFPNLLNQNFFNDVRLIGYEYGQRVLAPGDSIEVTLYWEALRDAPPDYLVEVALCQLPCADWMPKWQTITSPPKMAPTSSWQLGQIVADAHMLTLDPTLPPGSYSIHVTLIDATTKAPQNIVAEDGHYIDDRLLLSEIRVQP
ncbi:ArnT family glycosyltransferase [Candidatus Leptofilum sp.]|uniref:ArnT family glycosyltransferase n=1 Tax=Candidatus Leptofilum sp. TaxID=3241576 RepID=UPI003B5B5433